MADVQKSPSTHSLTCNLIHSNEFESLWEELFDIKRIVMSNRNPKPAYHRPKTRIKIQILISDIKDLNPKGLRPMNKTFLARPNLSPRQFDIHYNWQNNRRNSETNQFSLNRQENLPVSNSGVGSRQISWAGPNHSQ